MPNLNVYEKRPDWAAIVSAIPCPQQGCGAQAGRPCRNVGAGAYTLRSEQPRSDWHMTRKFLAVQIFEQQEPKSSTGEAMPDKFRIRRIWPGSNSIPVAEDRPVDVSGLPVGDGSDPGENEVGGLDEAHSGS